MDLPRRKIEFVQEFLKFQNESVISEFENLLRKKKKEKIPNPMSKEDLIKRIEQSESDFENGRFKSTEELLAKYQ